MAQFGKRSLDALKGVHPDLVEVMTEAIKHTPIDFTITIGVRTTAEQQKLYAQGRTAPGAIVTKADGVKNKSNHQVKANGFGYAVDLYPFVNGSVDVIDRKNYLPIIAGHILGTANRLGKRVQWGGLWDFVDKPHFELK